MGGRGGAAQPPAPALPARGSRDAVITELRFVPQERGGGKKLAVKMGSSEC